MFINRLKKGIAVLCTLTIAAGMATGCGNSSKSTLENTDKVLFSYDGTDVTLKEAYIYAKITAANYEQYYSSYFGSDFWTMDMGTGQTMEDNVKEQVISQIKQIIVLDKKAKKNKISLSKKEKKQCQTYADEFAKQDAGKEILNACGATSDDMEKIYEDNKLASKMQEEAVKDTDTNVSDDEARKTSITRIVFETTKTDDDGNTTAMTKKEKAAVKKKAEKALKEIQAGTSIEDEAEKQEYTNTSETFAAGESEEGTAFEKKLKKMKDGDMLDKVQECDNGYVIAKLVAYTDKDATEENKESIISQRQQEKFSEVYDEWTKKLEKKWDYDKDVDQTLWAEVVLHSEDSTATESKEQTTGEATSGSAESTTAAAGASAESTTAAAESTTAAEASTQAK